MAELFMKSCSICIRNSYSSSYLAVGLITCRQTVSGSTTLGCDTIVRVWFTASSSGPFLIDFCEGDCSLSSIEI